MRSQPPPRVRSIPGREDDRAETSRREPREKSCCAAPWRVPVRRRLAVSCSLMTADHREGAQACINDLAALLKSAGDAPSNAIVTECEGLSRAIAAIHMEGIRFRIYNVDRLLRNHPSPPAGAPALLEQARKHLEAAGFHTRSHQAPI